MTLNASLLHRLAADHIVAISCQRFHQITLDLLLRFPRPATAFLTNLLHFTVLNLTAMGQLRRRFTARLIKHPHQSFTSTSMFIFLLPSPSIQAHKDPSKFSQLRNIIASFSLKRQHSRYQLFLLCQQLPRMKRKRLFMFWWGNLTTHQRSLFQRPHLLFHRSPKFISFVTRQSKQQQLHLKLYPSLVAITENKAVWKHERERERDVGQKVDEFSSFSHVRIFRNCFILCRRPVQCFCVRLSLLVCHVPRR